MTNSHICSLIFFYLMLVLVRSDVIQDSCSKVAQGGSVNLDFCVATLEGNPKAKNATSLADLVPISIENAKVNATSVLPIISQILGNKSLEKHVTMILKYCYAFYYNANKSLQECEEDFEKKRYESATYLISLAIDYSKGCEEEFVEEGFTSPLTKENNDFSQLTGISLELIIMAQKG